VLVLPAYHAVIVTTGDPGFSFGPPPRDELPADWAPALELVRQRLLPALARTTDGLDPRRIPRSGTPDRTKT
jgi:hypothetical protein